MIALTRIPIAQFPDIVPPQVAVTATYTGAGAQNTVETMARAVDARGRPTKSMVEWTPSDPELVTVSPSQGEHVKITAKRAGESSLIVKCGGVSRKLAVKAAQPNGVWQVSISQ